VIPASTTRFVGEGRLGWSDVVGGRATLLPIVIATLVVAAMGAVRTYSPLALAVGLLVPAWLAWRMRLPHAVARALRDGRPAFRVELDELGVRTLRDTGARTTDLDWFELAHFHVAPNGIVLMMRRARGGANAIFVPRSFFAAAEWPKVEAFVREKMPSAARATEEAAKRAAQGWKRRSRRAVLGWLAIVALFTATYVWLEHTR